MFLVNVHKLLQLTTEVYVSTDSEEVGKIAERTGAKVIFRSSNLGGDTPNIPVYQHALTKMPLGIKGIVAVQACSPNVRISLIDSAFGLLEAGVNEVMTCHPIERPGNYHDQNWKVYGSIWGLSRHRLEHYGDPYKPNPEILLVDSSTDIHTEEDYTKAIEEYV